MMPSGMPSDLTAADREFWAGAIDYWKPTQDPYKTIRDALLAGCPTPADLAARFDPTYIRTEAGDLLSERIIEAVTTYDGRLTISQPPQTGKSLLLRWACVWLLLRNPDTRIVFSSYGSALARTSGRIIRSLIEMHCEPYGLTLDRSHADAADWQLEGRLGGVLAVGVGGSLTGRASSCLFIDDPHRSQADADSATMRTNVIEWWSAVARTRLAPGAPVVAVATRWHEQDLISTFIADGWPTINIPAQADGQTPDALGRPVGEYLITPRGTTPEDWRNTRTEVGERTWAALYQGRPAPVEGGIFKSGWFSTWRVPETPPGCLPPTVVVDPADNEGDGDEAGIIVATSHPATGKVYLLDDLSAPMTVARWARVALLTCVRRGAPTLAYERSLSQLPKRIREAWQQLHQQALALRRAGGDIEAALARLVRPDDPAEARQSIESALIEIVGSAEGILTFGETGPQLRQIVAKGSKTLRMQLIAPMFETGRAVIVGHLPVLEHQLCFPGGTLIDTCRGRIPIENVHAGDLALTRSGYQPVRWSGLSGYHPCTTLTTSRGVVLRATPGHRVWVMGEGWVPLDQVVPGCRMLECLSLLLGPAWSSRVADTTKITTCISNIAHVGGLDLAYCTAMSGPHRMAQSRLDGTYTTGITTERTMSYRTWKRFRLALMSGDINPEAGQHCLPNSDRLKVAKNGLGGSHEKSFAQTVGSSIALPDSVLNTAQNDATCFTMGTKYEREHVLNMPQVNKMRTATVLSVEAANGPSVPVYDLSVDGSHEFFANGLLVHNCTWQVGMDSPDRADAAAHSCALLNGSTLAALSVPDQGPPLPIRSTRSIRGDRSTMIPRSTMVRR